MKNIKVLAAGALCLLSACAYADADLVRLLPPGNGLGANPHCDRHDVQSLGEYSVHDDLQDVKPGTAGPTDFVECYSQPVGKDDVSVNFAWQFVPAYAGVRSYPHVTYGWDWNGRNTAKGLPLQVRNIKRLQAYTNYDIATPKGHNVSYDIWLSNSPTPKRENLTHEIMIWVDVGGLKMVRKTVERNAHIDGHVYDIHAGQVSPDKGGWIYMALLSQQGINKTWIDIGAVMSHLVSTGALDPSEYVNGISFGSEVSEGSGMFRIHNFKVLAEPVAPAAP